MGRARGLSERERQAWLAFLGAHHLLDRALGRRVEREAGLSPPQYEILARLDQAPGGEIRMTDLAAALFDAKSKLTYQIDRLEQAGLVRRRSCPADLRAVYAGITEAGRERLARAAPGYAATVREFFADVLTPGQLDAVAEGFTEIERRLRADPERAGLPDTRPRD